MVSDEALKKLQEQIMAWPMTQRFVVQQLIEDYRMDREDLRAYKATGLTPEEVLPKDKADEIAMKLMRLADLESLCSYTRLRELVEADKDGRLVVLPFSDADDVEMRRDGITYKSDHWNILLTAFADDYPTLSGRKLGVFSVKEAEKALEAKKNE